jgi:hypothetical protein
MMVNFTTGSPGHRSLGSNFDRRGLQDTLFLKVTSLQRNSGLSSVVALESRMALALGDRGAAVAAVR